MFLSLGDISETAKNILKKRYLKPGESEWKDVANRTVNHVCLSESGDTRGLILGMIENRYFIPNSPCLVNSGKDGGGLQACFVLPFEDTIEDIYKTKYDFARISRKGGGCGANLSHLRPENSPVAGSTHGYAGGPIKFADTVAHDMAALTQAGFRDMAIMFSMSVYHPDILKFIHAKADEGKLENANISVMVDDTFMEKVKNDETYTTYFDFKGGRMEFETYKAREVFNQIVDGVWRNGEPGILFYDHLNNSPYKFAGEVIEAVNPCLYKDTYLPTDNKIVKISDAYQGNRTSWKTGIKGCIKLTTNAGHEVILTPDHRIMLPDGSFLEAKDSLGIEIPWALGNASSLKHPPSEVIGFLFGDGFLCGKRMGVSVKLSRENEPEVFDMLTGVGFHLEGSGGLYINKDTLSGILGDPLEFLPLRVFDRDIPDNYMLADYAFLRSFVSGLFEANGSVTKAGQISLKTTNKSQAKKLQIILSVFGIESWIVTNKPSLVHWKNGDYTSKESYNLQIAPRNAYKFKEKIGFISNKKNDKIRKLDGVYCTKLRVVSIEPVGEMEVWDFSNETHFENANGIFVHNCGEQPLVSYGSCNLGSLDIVKFLDKDNTIDLWLLENAVRLSVRFLDDVMEVNSFPTPEIENVSNKYRPIGLGIMGLADYFIRRGVAYGSDKSMEELEFIMSFIYHIAEDESIILGSERGIPEGCKSLPVPRRNMTLLTIAPTGTISLLADCSSSIEPIFSEITLRNDKTGSYEIGSDENLPEHFRCAVSANGSKEVTWEEHVRMQASAQKFVDSGVSKTINFPNHTKKETIYKAFMLAWELGCKGITGYRNGSREMEVLSPKNLKKDLCPVCESPIVRESGCKHCTNCDWSMCEIG